MTYLVKIHLLSPAVCDKVSQIVQNVLPRILTCKDMSYQTSWGGAGQLNKSHTSCGILGKERKHMNIDRVNGIENSLRARGATDLITICELADGD